MAAEVSWQAQDKILLTVYRGVVTPAELVETIEVVIAHMDAANSTLHVIVDWRQASDYPYYADFMFPALKLIRHKNLGWIVLVGESGTLKIWVQLFARVSDFRYQIVLTPEAALEFLRTVEEPTG